MQTNPEAKKQIQQMLQDTGYERCHYRRKKNSSKALDSMYSGNE